MVKLARELSDVLEETATLRREEAALPMRLRAALHVGLEVDAWNGDELFDILSALAARPERTARLLRIVPRSPLGARMRQASLLRAFASIIRVRGWDAIIPSTAKWAWLETLTQLSNDRNSGVALRALAAVAMLSREEPGLWKAMAASDDAQASRRLTASKVFAWLLGDLDRSDVESALERSDDHALALSIEALRLGHSLAPLTTHATVLGWLGRAHASSLRAACVFAAFEPDAKRRAELDRAIRERSAAIRDPGPSSKRWLEMDPARRRAFDDLLSLRRSGADLGSARSLADSLVKRVGEWSATDDGDDTTIDAILFDTTIVRDILGTTERDAPGATAQRGAWRDLLRQVATRREQGVSDRHVHERVLNERLRGFVHALDAVAADDEMPWPAFFETLTRIASHAEKTVVDRNLAIGLTVALEAIVTQTDDADDYVAVVGLPDRLLHHFARTFSRPRLVGALRATSTLREALVSADRAPARTRGLRPFTESQKQAARALSAALTDVAGQVAGLGISPDHPLAMSMSAADAALQQSLSTNDATAAIASAWAAAVIAFERMFAEVATRHGQAPRAKRSREAVERRIMRLFESDDRDESATAGAVGAWPLDDLVRASIKLRGSLSQDKDSRRWPGTVLGDYVVIDKLGSGGMGMCLRARLRADASNRSWILKVPSQERRTHVAFREEALALLRLADTTHPSIVDFIAYQDRGYSTPFLVMGYVPGEPLEDLISKAPLPAERVFPIAARMASALAHAHARQIGHHDLKPSNVILRSDDCPVLVDWGMAGARFRACAGTPGYMPPERYARDPRTTEEALAGDVWALAAVVFEMITGQMLAAEPITAADAVLAPDLKLAYDMLPAGDMRFMAMAETIARNEELLAARVGAVRKTLGASTSELLVAMLSSDPRKRPGAAAVATRLRSVV